MKKLILVFLFVLLSVCVYAQDLTWDIVFQKGRTPEFIPISNIIRMETGETFQFSITPHSNAWCYIILYDSQRKVYVLHNERLSANIEKFFGPFQLEEPKGTETIYVILSLERQADLERLISVYNNSQTQADGNNVFRAIQRLQSSMIGEPASSYIPSGGTTRGTSSQQYATRFSGKNIYVRTIIIRH